MGFRIDISVIDLRGKILLYYIALNSSFIEDVLIFLFYKITLRINTRDSARKIPTDYVFEKAKKAKKIHGSKILNLK